MIIHTHTLLGARSRQEDCSRTGNVRANAHDYHLIMVADGMGGHDDGDRASAVAIDSFPVAFQEAAKAQPAGTEGDWLRIAFLLAHRRVRTLGEKGQYRGAPGTTLSVALIRPETRDVWLAWVGDSPILLLSGQDESHRVLLRATPHGTGGRLFNCLGGGVSETNLYVDVKHGTVCAGDVLIVASDGADPLIGSPGYGEIDPLPRFRAEMPGYLVQPNPAQAIAEAAVQVSGEYADNTTVIVVRF